jgi:hypothetical protein
MIKLVEMDENVKLTSQLDEEEEGKEDGGRPVILINKFNVKPEDVLELLTAIALPLALILVVDTSTSHGGTGFLGMSQEQTGQILGPASIVLFFTAFV